MFSFSQSLVDRLKSYSLACYGQELSDEAANAYLLSLSEVFLAIARTREARKEQVGVREAALSRPQGGEPAAPSYPRSVNTQSRA